MGLDVCKCHIGQLDATLDLQHSKLPYKNSSPTRKICSWNIRYPCDKCDKSFDQEDTMKVVLEYLEKGIAKREKIVEANSSTS